MWLRMSVRMSQGNVGERVRRKESWWDARRINNKERRGDIVSAD